MSDFSTDTADFLLDNEDEHSVTPVEELNQDTDAQAETAIEELPPIDQEPLPDIADEANTPEEDIESSPEPPSEAVAIDISPITQGMEELKKQLCELSDGFARKLRQDESKQVIIDRQHAELERYRQDEAFKLSKAIIMDVIAEVDSAEKSSKHYENLDVSPENFAKLKRLVLGISDDLRDLLERNDIYSYRSEPGTPFNAKRHRVLKTIPTGDAALAKTLQESVRWGFEAADKVIRHELVNVYAYDPKLSEQESPQAEPADPAEPSPEA